MSRGNFWDIDDFLAEAEPVTIQTTRELPKMGFLDQNAKTTNLPKDTRIQLPFWLGLSLAQYQFALIETPPMFRESYRSSLQADPTILTLRDRSQYFFRFGGKIAEFLNDTELTPILLQVFLQRFKFVLENIDKDNAIQLQRKLTNLEEMILKIGHRTRNELHEWESRMFERIHISKVLSRPKRRIRTT